jgi:hypothetical protein
MLLQPPSKAQCVADMALNPQRQSFKTLDELERTERVEARSQITENLNTDADGKRNRAESLPELEAVVSLRGLDELGESLGILSPVELSRVDDDTGDGGAVSTDPLCGRVDDNVGTCLFVSTQTTTRRLVPVGMSDIPCSIGLTRKPPAPKVLSTTNGIPWS